MRGAASGVTLRELSSADQTQSTADRAESVASANRTKSRVEMVVLDAMGVIYRAGDDVTYIVDPICRASTAASKTRRRSFGPAMPMPQSEGYTSAQLCGHP